jgi:putative flippase GtrA
MEMLAEFIRKHPWWQWLTRTPFSAKMTKYALSSVIAFLLSDIAFALSYALSGGQTTVSSVIAFFSAAIPNWIMNRRWAWQQTGRAPMKQMISYAAVSAFVLVATALGTGRTNYWVKHDAHIANHHGLRLLIVTSSFVLVTVVLFFLKFAIYEFLIFRNRRAVQDPPDEDPPGPPDQDDARPGAPGRRRLRLSSRRNVNKIARANRIP